MEINFAYKKGIGLDRFLPSGCPQDLKDILGKLLEYDPYCRISAEDALKHDYFAEFLTQIDKLNLTNKDFRSTFMSSNKQTNYSKEKSE